MPAGLAVNSQGVSKVRKSTKIVMASLAAVSSVFLATAAPATGTSAAPLTPMTLDQMSQDPNLWGVTLSRDGKHIAGIAGVPGQNPVIRIWKTYDMSAAPVSIGSRTMRFTGVQFVKNDRLMMFANQPVSAGAFSNWRSKVAFASIDGREVREMPSTMPGLTFLNSLPNDPDHVIIQGGDEDTAGVFKVNIRNMTSERLFRIGDNGENYAVGAAPTNGGVAAQGITDKNGNLRVRQVLDVQGEDAIVAFEFKNASGAWVKMPALSYNIKDRFSVDPIMLSDDESTLMLITDKLDNFATVRRYNIATDTLSEPLFKNTEFDASAVSFWTAADSSADRPASDEPTGFCYSGPATECVFLDATRQRIMGLLEQAMPGRQISISPRDSGRIVLVTATANDVPTEYYLLKNERELIRIGSMLEGPKPQFGKGEWVYYPARDGLMIPAIITYPAGYDKARDGRVPLVVMPHGGPWSRDSMGWDRSNWTQMFATRGFAVLQPQYRGSAGLGMQLWKAGDGEWGAKMQDDKDDGARWMVAQGIADPDRMMMYGYSYGGFAAASAATRSSDASAGLWQCAISGAPAIDLARIENDWGDNRIQRRSQGWTVNGRDPFKDLDKVRIPWLVFHGDYDRQADTVHSRTTAARIRQVNAGANFRYVEIPRMAHQLVQMTPDHRRWFTGLMLNYMDTNCGNISSFVNESDPEMARQAARTR
jgi:dipeptidyl aminopeptidase/acylaminoacyl peptidase